jgi:hypothetical protein
MDDSPETSRLLPVLEKWQDVLGEIRDSDIFISGVEDGKSLQSSKRFWKRKDRVDKRIMRSF